MQRYTNAIALAAALSTAAATAALGQAGAMEEMRVGQESLM